MRSLYTLAAILLCFGTSAQQNPVQNLTWMHDYFNMQNYFELGWSEPESPHDELLGYNVYQENHHFMFLTENYMYLLPQGSNCSEEFLLYNDGQGFQAHVTAVYASGESSFVQTVFVEGAMLTIDEKHPAIYRDPATGMWNIESFQPMEISVFDFSGRLIKVLAPQSEIDLSDLGKGFYLIQLTSGNLSTTKIIIQ